MTAPIAPTATVPPASVPLGFLGAAAVGMIGFGLSAMLAADKIVASPYYPGTLSTVHVAMLAFLTVAVLGALHQFAPVIGRRPLRSVALARLTCVGMVTTGWVLPTGFAHGPEDLIPIGGLIGTASVLAIVWNLSAPLGRGAVTLPVRGLRCSLAFLVATVLFGVVYAFNRQTGWFPLFPHRVLAHAHLGLLGWLGLTYVAVAEKLWPMFLLSHRPSDRSGHVAVWSVAAGVAVLAPGLLLGIPVVAWIGGITVGVGAVAHLTSLATHVRHRRRPLEVLHAYVITSSGFLVLAIVLATAAGALDVTTTTRTRLVSAEVMALTAWLGLAIVGHVHKIVPFVGYQTLRSRGVSTGPSGRPLLFGDLFSRRLAWVSLVLGASGATAMSVGILSATEMPLATGAALLSATGFLTAANLVAGHRRVRRSARGRPGVQPGPASIGATA